MFGRQADSDIIVRVEDRADKNVRMSTLAAARARPRILAREGQDT